MRLIIEGYLGNGQVAARHAILHLTPAGCLSSSPDWITSLQGPGAREGKRNEIPSSQQSALGPRVPMFNPGMRSGLRKKNRFSDVAFKPLRI